jgi:bacteriorhodopsin
MDIILHRSTQLSIIAQALSGAVNVNGLTKTGPKLFVQALRLEMLVTVIQFTFYVALIRNLKVETMATTRYFDWFLTTPMMLISMSAYFLYKKGEDSSIIEMIKKYKSSFALIVLSNLVMLIAGYLGEIGYISKTTSFIVGTIALIVTFRTIDKDMDGSKNAIFKPIAAVWGLYGLAFMLPVYEKNIMYNMLDVVSKNFFAVFLTRELYTLVPKR